MKKFIIQTIIFIIIPIIGDVIISHLPQPKNGFYKWHDLYNNKINADLMIFGSSRARNHFNIKIIEDSLLIDSYNFGIPGGEISLAVLCLVEHLRKCSIKPKYITLEIDWFSIQNKKKINSNWQLFPYMLFNYNMYKYTHDYEGYYDYYYFIPMARYLKYPKEIYQNIFALTNNYIFKGYYSDNSHYQNEMFFKHYLSDTNVDITPDAIAYLKKFIDICNENNIKLNLVYTPEYLEATQLVNNRQMIIDYILHFSEDNNIPFIDFSKPSFYNDTTFFSDMRHLNSLGADKFTSEYYVPWIKQIYGL